MKVTQSMALLTMQTSIVTVHIIYAYTSQNVCLLDETFLTSKQKIYNYLNFQTTVSCQDNVCGQ